MATTTTTPTATPSRRQGDKAVVRQVMRLYREGWHIPNIAHISGLTPAEVQTILERRSADTSEIMK